MLFLLLVFFFLFFFLNFNNKMSAQVVENSLGKKAVIFGSNCYDSDGTNYYEKGYREFKERIQEDFCLNLSEGKSYVKEYYCYGESVQECSNGCFEGACRESISNKKVLANFLEDARNFFRKVI